MRTISLADSMHVYGGLAAGVDYTFRITVKMADPVDAVMLQKALDLTWQRYLYLSVRFRQDSQAYYYEENPLPVVLRNTEERTPLNTPETNYHLWAVCYQEDRIHLDCFHGLTDGTGAYRVLATLLYYYCRFRYGTTDPAGILTLDELPAEEEMKDPLDGLSEQHPEDDKYPPFRLEPAFTLETDGGLTPSEATLWDVEIPEKEFIRFTSANDASPGTMISLLFARVLDKLYPDRQKEITSAYVINARPMLHLPLTYHNCLDMAIFRYTDRVKKFPFMQQCMIYRGKTFIQSEEDKVVNDMVRNEAGLKAVLQSSPSLEEKKQKFTEMFNGGEGYCTFLVSYIGKWPYPALGEHILQLWAHPPNTFSLMVEIGAANGRIFLSIQQRFREDTIREAFLKELEENLISYKLCRVMRSDIPQLRQPVKLF